ncbi:hypothetical protein DPEC_G00163520 [Dallia pectoralis]|uniref:Uncharacterized protein n=1 Tax=Dallia pectoralis TaxID=75939 RepID=A0ACC2GH59_DALPE|nr:hypothetical protein DPEC_G00163520 [Dallia pectoralis]
MVISAVKWVSWSVFVSRLHSVPTHCIRHKIIEHKHRLGSVVPSGIKRKCAQGGMMIGNCKKLSDVIIVEARVTGLHNPKKQLVCNIGLYGAIHLPGQVCLVYMRC